MAISQNFPDVRPSLNLNFARSKTLDPRITFERASIGTYVDENGLIKTAAADEARFDHNPETGESLGLLIEEARTNIHTYSIPDSNWTQSNCTLTLNNTIAPDNTQTASLFTGTGGSSVGHYIYLNHPTVAGTFYTQTFFVKAGTTEFVQIATSTGWPSRYANFQLTGDGVVGNEDIVGPVTIEKYPNGWYRIRVTEEAINTYAGNSARMILSSVDSLTVSRIPQSSEKTFYVWGAQLEQGSFPTSYIPTSGSTVTRQPDNASITGTNFSSWYNQSEGTFSFRAKSPTNPVQYPVVIDDSTNNNRHLFAISDAYQYQIKASGSTEAQIDAGSVFSSFNYIAGGYKTNNTAVALNGSVDVDNVASIPTCNRLSIYQFSGFTFTGTISRLTYYPERLTNAQLQNLTK